MPPAHGATAARATSLDGVMSVADTARLVESVKRHEGLRLKPYQDTAGKCSIGYGRNLDDVGISREEAEEMLATDLARTHRGVLTAWPWVADLDPVRAATIIEMAYNLGVRGLAQFTQTLGAVASRRFDDAARAMLQSHWAEQVGQRATTLARRMKTGQWE
jgi:lysozyme